MPEASTGDCHRRSMRRRRASERTAPGKACDGDDAAAVETIARMVANAALRELTKDRAHNRDCMEVRR